jgi:transcriptional antiterminator RfaH|tara:strand:- start:65 stop:598 length:534 start_codon:yes stop_codon:yes gene_type:complete
MKKVKQKKTIWLLIYTKANEEEKANANLQKQGFKTYLPLIPSNKKNKSLIPVFPRYLFAEIDLDLGNWTSINSTYGVHSIVLFSEKLTSIPSSIIEKIKTKLDQPGMYKEKIHILEHQKGDQVHISKGKFSGIDAIFLSNKSKDRVRLLLKFLNTSVITELSRFDIKQKELIENFKL